MSFPEPNERSWREAADDLRHSDPQDQIPDILDRATDAVFGATRKPIRRLYEHLIDVDGYPNNKKCQWIKSLVREGLKPIMDCARYSEYA